ncbi:MAG: hypothetical protein R3A48_07525 [Polyangiales bacterium]
MKLPIPIAACLLFASAPSGAVARAQPGVRDPSPLALLVTPEAGGSRWRFSLRNQSSAPLTVIADRRLLTLEFPPAQPTGPRRRRAVRRRCAHSDRPAINEFAPRVTLAPGESYSELFDLRDQCALRVPTFAAGDSIAVRYGWDGSSRRSMMRSLLVDEGPTVLPSLVTTVTAPEAPVEAVDEAGGAALQVRASGSQAARGEGLRAAVRLVNPSAQPTWTFYRNGMWSFEVLRPDGVAVTCDALTRQPGARRDFFVRIGARGGHGATLVPDVWCPRGTFARPGVYEARAVFESAEGGDDYGLQQVFTGRVSSRPFFLRVSRGSGRYVPWSPSRQP